MKLKPCPFCGGGPQLYGRDPCFVLCNQCGAHGGYRLYKSEASEAWNRRADQADGVSKPKPKPKRKGK